MKTAELTDLDKTLQNIAWNNYLKNPLKRTNGYLTTYKSLFKIVNLKLCRHFSYVELAKVKRDGSLSNLIYLSAVGSSWESTNKKLAERIQNYVQQTGAEWIDLSAISS